MRVTQPFGISQGREPVERQMVVFRQPLDYLWDIKLEVVSKPLIMFESKAQADPPSLAQLWRDK